MKHVDYMLRCIHLAQKGKGWVNPNPMVGALLVHNDVVISEGYHRAFGEAHAESDAIRKINNPSVLQESTLYVNLEPCAHYGKTPPCASLIIETGIPKVVVAMRDPNPLVAGKGIAMLREAGIEVIENICTEEALKLNRFFIKYHTRKKPFVLAKWAETQNGFIAPVPKREAFISGNDTRMYTHALRQEVSAVLVGVGTWQIDQPQLTDRFHGGPQPIRIVFDPDYSGNYDAALSSDLSTWVITENIEVTQNNFKAFSLPGLRDTPQLIIDFLYKKHINSVLIEGGAATLNYFIKGGCVDEIHRFLHNDLIWPEGIPAPKTDNFTTIKTIEFEQSLLTIHEPS